MLQLLHRSFHLARCCNVGNKSYSAVFSQGNFNFCNIPDSSERVKPRRGGNNGYLKLNKHHSIEDNQYFQDKFASQNNLIQSLLQNSRSHRQNNRNATYQSNQNQHNPTLNDDSNLNNNNTSSNLQSNSSIPPDVVIQIQNIIFLAYRLKKNMNITESNLKYFYQNKYLQSKELQQISSTLSELKDQDFHEFLSYTLSVTLKDHWDQLSPNSKLDTAINLFQANLAETVSGYIKTLILSIKQDSFSKLSLQKVTIVMRYISNLIPCLSFRDLDYLNEQLSQMFIVNIAQANPFILFSICQSIKTLSSINSRACFPFRQLINELQIKILHQMTAKNASIMPDQQGLLAKPKFLLSLVEIMKFNSEINMDLVNHIESALLKVQADHSQFKSHLLFFNSLSVINGGEKILQEIAQRIQDKTSLYYKEAESYEITYIIKLMYNEQLLYAQRQTTSLWQKKQLFKEDLDAISVFHKTDLFIELDKLISQHLRSARDIKKLDNKTLLILRRIYLVIYKDNQKLSSLIEEQAKSSSSLFENPNSSNSTINELNSDVMAFLKSKELPFEVEKNLCHRDCDIFVPSLNLVIELDGKYHQMKNTKLAKDQFRDITYLKLGYRLLVINIAEWEILRVQGTIFDILAKQIELLKENQNLIMVSI